MHNRSRTPPRARRSSSPPPGHWVGHIKIKTGVNKYYILDASGSMRIAHVKMALRQALNVPIPLQRIYDLYANQFATCDTLSDCGVQDRDTLFMVEQASADCDHECACCAIKWLRLVEGVY